MSVKKKYRTADDYLQYLKGELSNRERHSLERELESDPFLMEAMEGLESISPEMSEEDLLSLHSRLAKRLARRRRVAFYSIAATVASLLIVGTIFLRVHDFNPVTEDESPYLEEPAAVDQAELAGAEQSEPVGADQAELAGADQGGQAGVEQEETTGSIPKGAEAEMQEKDEPKESIPEREKVPEEAMADEEPVIHMEAEPVTEGKSGETGAGQVERVVMEKAAPVAEDRVDPVSGEEIELSAPLKVEEAEPVTTRKKAESKGLRTESVSQPAAARAPEMQKTTLYTEESVQPAAEEVNGILIVSDDTESPAAPVEALSTSPEPVGGYDAYRAYIEENIKFPTEDTTTRKAMVILKFTVTVSGDITNVEVLRHPGDPYAKEALRLLEEGPSWNPAIDENGLVEDVVRMKILFKR